MSIKRVTLALPSVHAKFSPIEFWSPDWYRCWSNVCAACIQFNTFRFQTMNVHIMYTYYYWIQLDPDFFDFFFFFYSLPRIIFRVFLFPTSQQNIMNLELNWIGFENASWIVISYYYSVIWRIIIIKLEYTFLVVNWTISLKFKLYLKKILEKSFQLLYISAQLLLKHLCSFVNEKLFF